VRGERVNEDHEAIRYLGEDNEGHDYATAIRANGLIFVSGQLGVSAGEAPVSFEDQLRTALRKLVEAVEVLGGSKQSLLKVNGYIADVKWFSAYHRVYREEFGDTPRPCRTTVQVGGFEEPILLEMDAIAAVEARVSDNTE
jgi:2-iminobutanoate/2-iminopropanoate deaminase